MMLFFSVFLFVLGPSAEELGEAEKISCPHSEEKAISFSGWDARDSLELRLLGEACAKAVVSIVILSEKGNPIFWDIWPLWNLSVHRLQDEGQVERTFKELQGLSASRSTEIPDLNSDCFTDEYCYLGQFVESAEYEKVKRAELPVLCIPVHYENTRCYFYDNEQKVSKLLYGFGA